MFDFLRNLTKSAAEKRQETITAYLDDSLSPTARARFEAELAQDATLQADLERERAVKQALSQLPQRRTPRNFTLDPALYGRPAKQPLIQAYPVLRMATGLAAIFFIFAVVAGIFTSGNNLQTASDVAFAPMAEPVTIEVTRVVTETVVEEVEEIIEVTRVVTETVVEELVVEEAEEAMAEEEAMVEGEVEVMEEEAEEAADSAPEEEALDTAVMEDTQETAGATASESEATQAIATATAIPTATTSPLPRATATTALERAFEPTAAANDMVENDAPAPDETTETTIQETAVPAQEPPQPPTPINTLFIIQIGLLLLLLILGALTLYTRRQL